MFEPQMNTKVRKKKSALTVRSGESIYLNTYASAAFCSAGSGSVVSAFTSPT